MKQVLEMRDAFLMRYEESFLMLLVIVALYVIYIIYKLSKVNEWDKDDIVYSLKYELEKMLVEFLLVVFLIWLVYAVFDIDILEKINIKTYGKLIFGIWLVIHLYQFHDSIKHWNRNKYIKNVNKGKYLDPPELIFAEQIKRYKVYIDLQKEKISILKSYTPMALIVLIIGRLLDGADVNIYIIIFFGCTFSYGYYVWRQFKKLGYLMMSKHDFEKELSELERKGSSEEKENLRVRIARESNNNLIHEPDSGKLEQRDSFKEPDGTIRYVDRS